MMKFMTSVKGSPKFLPRAPYVEREFLRELERLTREIMADSVTNYVPIMDGNLAASAFIQPPAVQRGGLILFAFGYNAPYARSVHENPRSGKTGGVSPLGRRYKKWAKTGQWKYLEIPVAKRKTGISRRLRDALTRAMKSGAL